MDFVKATKPLQKIHCIIDALFPIGKEKYPGFSLIFLFCLFDIWCLPEGFVKKLRHLASNLMGFKHLLLLEMFENNMLRTKWTIEF